ncbi:MAG: tape measure protein [Rhodocyclaceae bacterium]|nr:tape measure protein [Rhodocyclaceae bacterium]
MSGARDLVIRIRGDSAEFVTAVAGADRSLAGFDQNIEKVERSASSATSTLARLGAGISAVAATREIVRTADEWGQYASRMRMATDSAEEYSRAQSRMLASANETYRSITETRESFIQMSPVLRQMGLDLDQSVDALDTFSGLLVVNAANAERGAQAQGALSKSLQTGKVDAEAWQSLLRAMPSLVTLLAQSTGMAEAEIRRLGISGKLSIDALVRTLVEGNETVQAQVAGMPTTVADALQKLRNGFSEYVGGSNEALGLTAKLAAGIGTVGENFELIAELSLVAAAALGGKYAAALVLTTASRVKDTLAVRAATIAEIAYQRQLAATAGAQAAAALTATERTAALGRQTVALQAASLGTASLARGAGLARGALALLGGPIGATAALIAGGIAIWPQWGGSAVEALTKAREAGRSLLDVLGDKYFRPEKLSELQVMARQIEQLHSELQKPATGMHASPVYRQALERQLAQALAIYERLAAAAQTAGAAIEEAGTRGASAAAAMSTSETDYLEALQRRIGALVDGNDALAQAERWIRANTDATEMGSDAIRKAAAELNRLQRQQEASREQADALRRQAEAMNQWVMAQVSAAQQLGDSSAQVTQNLREQLETVGLSTTQLAAYRAEKLRTAAATNEHAAAELEAAAAILKAKGILPNVVSAYRALAQARRDAAREQLAQASITIETAAAQASVDAAREAEAEWLRTAQSIEQSLTDALMRGFEDGAGFAQNFRDVLVNMFRTLVLRPLIQPIMMQAAGGIAGMLPGNAPAGQGQFGVGDLMNNLGGASGIGNTLGTAYANASGTGLDGLINATGGWGTAPQTWGAGVGASVMPMLSAYGLAQQYGPVGGMLGSVGSTALAGGVGGLASGAGFGAGAMGALSAVPVWGWIAAAALAILGGSEPNVPTNYWQQTTRDLGTGQVLSQTNNPDSRRHSPENLAASDALSQYAVQLNALLHALSGQRAADTVKFGIGSRDKQLWIDDAPVHEGDRFSRMSLDELRTVFDAEMVSRVFDALSDDMQRVVGEISDAGRAMGDALQSVIQIDPLNDWLTRLNLGVIDLSLAGADATDHLLQLTGGIENLVGAQRAYYSEFFSESERFAHLSADLAAALDELGYGMVHTRSEFRAIVEGLDLMSEDGRETYARLLALAPEMDRYLDQLEEQSDMTRAAAEASRSYRSAMSAQIRTVQDGVSRLQRLSSLLRGTLDRMSLGTLEEETMRRDSARAQIEAALAIARASGGRTLPEPETIAPALSRLAEPSAHLYASFTDYARDFHSTAGTIAGLLEITDEQLSVEERTLRWLQTRSEVEDGQHAEDVMALGQIDARGVETVTRLDEINETLRAAFSDEISAKERRRQDDPVNRFGNGHGDLLTIDALSSDWAEMMGLTREQAAGIIAQRAGLGRDTPSPVWAALPLQEGGAFSERAYLAQNADVAAAVAAGQFSSAYEHWMLHGQYEDRIPGFASGGDHFGGLRIVGERGWEIEATGPARYWSHADSMRMLAGGERRDLAAEEIRQLRAEFRAVLDAIAGHTHRAAKMLEQFEYNGLDVRVEA